MRPNRWLNNSAVVDRAISLLAAGGASALAAADLLATPGSPTREVAALARAFADAEPAVRARLCAAIARTPHGGGWLAALIASPSEPLQVRAAAAWAARGLSEARAALEIAARGPEGPLAANARAALAGAGAETRRRRAPAARPRRGAGRRAAGSRSRAAASRSPR